MLDVGKTGLWGESAGSHEALLHQVGPKQFGLDLRGAPPSGALTEALRQPRLQRSVGVLYQGATEQQELESHYFTGCPPAPPPSPACC